MTSTWTCWRCGPDNPIEISVPLWATMRLGAEASADRLTVDGLRTEEFDLACKLCGKPIDDLPVQQRANAQLKRLETEIGAELPQLDTVYIRDGVQLPPVESETAASARAARPSLREMPCEWVVELTTPRGKEVFGPYTYVEATALSPDAHRIGRSAGYRYSPWRGQISVRVRGLSPKDQVRRRIERREGFESLTPAEASLLGGVQLAASLSVPNALEVRRGKYRLGTVHPALHEGCWQANVAVPGRAELAGLGDGHRSVQHAVIAVAGWADRPPTASAGAARDR